MQDFSICPRCKNHMALHWEWIAGAPINWYECHVCGYVPHRDISVTITTSSGGGNYTVQNALTKNVDGWSGG